LKKSIQIQGYTFTSLISENNISERVQQLAEQINNDYAGEEIVLLITLKGAILFAADLMRNLDLELTVETIIAKSYGKKLTSNGDVQIIENINKFSGKHIIIIEDIIDTGNTINALTKKLFDYYPASIEICSLILKPESNTSGISVKYVGFEIEPKFVIGYGMDFNEFGRNLKDIYIIED